MNILVVSFVSSHVYGNSAGNMSHIYLMTRYLKDLGHKIYFLYIDVGWEKYDLNSMKKEWDYVEVVKSNEVHKGFNKYNKFDFAYEDAIGEVAKNISVSFNISMCICHYVVYSRVFEVIPQHILKVLDTHDILTNRYKLFNQYLIPKEFFNLSKKHESMYLNRANIIIARTEADRLFFNQITNSTKSITLTYFMSNQTNIQKQYDKLRYIGFVGSNNKINILCILQFLKEFDKEFKKGNLQNIKVIIVGNVLSDQKSIDVIFDFPTKWKIFQQSLSFRSFINIFKPNLSKYYNKHVKNSEYFINEGFVQNLDDFYNKIDLIVIPISIGTGVNIKTAEAISKGVPIISTVNGFKGFESSLKEHNAINIKQLVSYIKEIQLCPQKLQLLAEKSNLVFANYLNQFKQNVKKLFNFTSDKKVLNVPSKKKYLYGSSKSYCSSADNPIHFTHVANPKVTIIIPVYNNLQLILNCCNAILNNTSDVSYEVIIIDDASTDEVSNLENYIHNVIIIKNKENLGFIKSVNKAAEVAKGEYLLLLNNDTLVTSNWLKYILNTFDMKKDAGIVGGMLLNSDSSVQEAGGFMANYLFTCNINKDNTPLYSCEYLKTVDYVSGACLCISTELFFKVGKLDEIYGLGYSDDSDLCMKVRELGYEVYYQPKAKIFHLGSQTFKHTRHTIMADNNKILFTKFKEQIRKNCWTINPEDYHADLFLIRNRSKHKQTILCFDEMVPSEFHGGGKSSLCYLKTFVKMGLNVKFCPEYINPSEQSDVENLQQMGIEVIYPREEIGEFIKQYGKYIDYVFLQRPYSCKYIFDLKKYTRAKLLYYGHDIHFVRFKQEYELTGDNKFYRYYYEHQRVERDIIKLSDTVYYASLYELQYLNSLFPAANIQLLNPLYYSSEDINTVSQKSIIHKKNTILFVGSSHSHNIEGLKWFINNVWCHFKQNNISLLIVGSIKQAFMKAGLDFSIYSDQNIFFLGEASKEELLTLYQEAKLSINPSLIGGGFITKVIESIYYRIPVVSTLEGVKGINNMDYQDLIYIATDAKDFVVKIKELLDPNYTFNEQKAKQFIEQHFTQDIIIKQLEKGLFAY